MNKRGQALVEFVIILPFLILLVFAFIDFGRIIMAKTHLENTMNEVVKVSDENINDLLNEDTDYKIKYEVIYDKYRKITLKTKLDLITPGLKNILHNPYEVKVERSVLYE